MANLTAKFKLIDEMSDRMEAIADSGHSLLSEWEQMGGTANSSFGTAASAADGVASSFNGVSNSAAEAAQATDHWTDAVGNYDKGALEAIYSTEELVEMGLKSADALAEQDEMFNTKSKMLQTIMVSMGGRIAEELEFSDITTGASEDIRQATEVARDMVMKYGMSERIGFINYEQQQDAVFMGRDLGHMKTYGPDVYNEIESEVKRIIGDCYEKAKEILIGKRDVLTLGAERLIETEKMTKEEFEAIYYGESRSS